MATRSQGLTIHDGRHEILITSRWRCCPYCSPSDAWRGGSPNGGRGRRDAEQKIASPRAIYVGEGLRLRPEDKRKRSL
jgi:hypothetical protein